MKTSELMDGVEILDPMDGLNRHPDERGQFTELYGKSFSPFVEIKQISQSTSKKSTIRGIHIQYQPEMKKIVRCVAGTALFNFVDLRYGYAPKTSSITLFGSNSERLISIAGWVGVGFEALEDGTRIEYWHNSPYNAETSIAIKYDDPDIGIIWPSMFSHDKIVSERDQKGMSYKEWTEMLRTIDPRKAFPKRMANPIETLTAPLR